MAQFKGLVKIIFYTEVFINANIKITVKMLLRTKILILFLQDYVKSGCAIAVFRCILILRSNS